MREREYVRVYKGGLGYVVYVFAYMRRGVRIVRARAICVIKFWFTCVRVGVRTNMYVYAARGALAG